jgi:hypothetical protein
MSLKSSSLPPIESNLRTKVLGETLLPPLPVAPGPMAARKARNRSRRTTSGGPGRICAEARQRESNGLGLSSPEHIVNRRSATPPATDKDPLVVDVPREFHRRMAAIIDAVQTGIWQEGVHDLLGYATDYAFGQERGLQTLVLKSKHRSAYVRLHWNTVMGDAVADRQLVDEAIRKAIIELR